MQLTQETRSGPGIAVNDLPHVGPKKAILFGKAIIVNLFQRFKMVLNALVVLRFLGFAGLVNRESQGNFALLSVHSPTTSSPIARLIPGVPSLIVVALRVKASCGSH
jgi:hypothetical protein